MKQTARLTPAWRFPCQGTVHSVFQRVVNVLLETAGEQRMLVLAAPGLPRLPDSLCLPCERLAGLEVGMPVCLTETGLWLNGAFLEWSPDGAWNGRMEPLPGKPDWQAFLRATQAIPTGWDRLPPRLRAKAEKALENGNAQAFLGLGGGLTPSFDDACVGAMALCRALGKPVPFTLSDLTVTTDVSARYLRLAQEGYFGEPLHALMAALFGKSDLTESIRNLLNVGATSGSDMLFGVRKMALNENK